LDEKCIWECTVLDKYVINGGRRLSGEVSVSGAKNAAVAIIPAVVLADGPCRIENIPNISDVTFIAKILQEIGANVKRINKSTLEIDPRTVSTSVATYEQVKGMRASYYLLGALLGRYKKAQVAMPGGCDFGVRPVDQHLKGFAALGAKHELINGAVISVQADRLLGSHIYLDVVSVGATMNIMLAAVKAEGLTVIENAAKEPHIVDLANFLNSMGADVRGAGTDVIKIRGVEHLHGTTYSIIPDQIEAGTYMVAAAATNGDVLIRNVIPKHLESITAKLREMGAVVEEYDEDIRVRSEGRLSRCNIKTMPHPGFPTDMQPQFAALLSVANGTSIINENVWDNRFRYVAELCRMGAQISVDGRLAIIEGVEELIAAPVKATDLRAGAAMIIAGLVANGSTEIENIIHIERGYEEIVDKFQKLGADIKKERTRTTTEVVTA
jgi:UDP-N-acetylglucosamine 1-carboxyvinyltransferase